AAGALMIGPEDLPAVNALLNATSAVLVSLGYVSIRHKRIARHKACMLSAFAVSTIFLASYLYYHFAVRHGQPTEFTGQGLARPVYFSVLLSHMVLAAVVAPMVLVTVFLGLSNRLVGHVRLAQWTLPIWLYVS